MSKSLRHSREHDYFHRTDQDVLKYQLLEGTFAAEKLREISKMLYSRTDLSRYQVTKSEVTTTVCVSEWSKEGCLSKFSHEVTKKYNSISISFTILSDGHFTLKEVARILKAFRKFEEFRNNVEGLREIVDL